MTLNEKKRAETESTILVEPDTEFIETNDEVLEGVPGVTSLVLVSTEGVEPIHAAEVYTFNLEQNEKATSVVVIPSMVSGGH